MPSGRTSSHRLRALGQVLASILVMFSANQLVKLLLSLEEQEKLSVLHLRTLQFGQNSSCSAYTLYYPL